MSNRKLQELREYRYGPRGVLCPGDLFRVSGGPVYDNGDGSKSLMAERGTFKFVRYCVKGADKWIEAHRVGGSTVVLWVGKAGRNPDLPSFKRRPYKVRKVTQGKGKRQRKQGTGQKKEGAGQKTDALGAAGASGGARRRAKAGQKTEGQRPG
jgi:hypothetical protein